MQIDDYTLVRPLSSSDRFQEYYATKHSKPFRLIRWLAPEAGTVECFHRSSLVFHKNVLPIAVVKNSKNVLVTSTPFIHQQHFDTLRPNAEELSVILLAVAQALAASHEIGIAHGALRPSKIYWTDSNAMIDLIDGDLSGASLDARVGAFALAEDVCAFGTLMQAVSHRTSALMDSRSHLPMLIASMLHSDWLERPTMAEVADRLAKSIRPPLTTKVSFSF